MDIKIINEAGGIIQYTDKPIVNVFGDVNMKDEKKQSTVDELRLIRISIALFGDNRWSRLL